MSVFAPKHQMIQSSPIFGINPKLEQCQEQYRLNTLFYLMALITVPISLDEDISNFLT